jgi:hypothetical protein
MYYQRICVQTLLSRIQIENDKKNGKLLQEPWQEGTEEDYEENHQAFSIFNPRPENNTTRMS